MDSIAVTLVDGVRVRSEPRVSDDSIKYEPLLALGTRLYVLGGPVSASGYRWYEVAPLSSRSLPRGWVASAGRDGEPWLGAGFLGSGSPQLLVEPHVTTVPSDSGWFGLNLDPTGQYPDPLPIGQVVKVTGLFDHPAAASCTRTEMDGEPASTHGCRLEFAVTRLISVGP